MISNARTAKNLLLKRALLMLSHAAMPCRNEGTPQRHRILENKKRSQKSQTNRPSTKQVE